MRDTHTTFFDLRRSELLPFSLRQPEFSDDFVSIKEIPLVFVPFFNRITEAKYRERIGDLCPQQHDQPGKINPDQEHGDHCNGTIDCLIGGHRFDIKTEAVFRQFEKYRGSYAANHGIAPVDIAIRDQDIHETEGDSGGYYRNT